MYFTINYSVSWAWKRKISCYHRLLLWTFFFFFVRLLLGASILWCYTMTVIFVTIWLSGSYKNFDREIRFKPLKISSLSSINFRLKIHEIAYATKTVIKISILYIRKVTNMEAKKLGNILAKNPKKKKKSFKIVRIYKNPPTLYKFQSD